MTEETEMPSTPMDRAHAAARQVVVPTSDTGSFSFAMNAVADATVDAAVSALLSDEEVMVEVVRQAITSAHSSGRTVADPLHAASIAVVVLKAHLLREPTNDR